jgi:hypothetical protein
MTKRWHIKPDGTLGECNASVGSCPYGEENHITSGNLEQANQQLQERLEQEYGCGIKKPKCPLQNQEKFKSQEEVMSAFDRTNKPEYSDVSARRAVAENSNTPVHVLDELANDKDILVQINVARNPNTPSDTLVKMLPKDSITGWIDYNDMGGRREDGEEFVAAIAENPNTPVYVLEGMARSSQEYIRLFVGYSPYAPAHVLEKLANDEDEATRDQAKSMLQERTEKVKNNPSSI